jgi:calcineurin-like phosphoesterase family protein
MVANWRKQVQKNDTILHLGDLMMGGDEYYGYFWCNIAPQLTGKKYLILGNHDKRNYDYEALGFKVIKPFSINYRGYEVSFNHYPKLFEESQENVLHVHGHIHNHVYSKNEPTRRGNINVSVEVMNYKPRRATRLLNKAITKHNAAFKNITNQAA